MLKYTWTIARMKKKKKLSPISNTLSPKDILKLGSCPLKTTIQFRLATMLVEGWCQNCLASTGAKQFWHHP